MGLFSKKTEIKPKLDTRELSTLELKNVINAELNKELTKNLKEWVDKINKSIELLKNSLEKLKNAEPSGDFEKALVIGVNQSRLMLYNFFKSSIIIKQPANLIELNDYLAELNNFMINSRNNLSRHIGRLSAVYKNESLKVIDVLDSLNESVNKLLIEISGDSDKTKKLFSIKNRLIELDDLMKKLSELQAGSREISKSLEDIDIESVSINNKLNELINSGAVKRGIDKKADYDRICNELSAVKAEAFRLVSLISRALRKFSHSSDNKLINDLVEDPLNLIIKHRDDYIKLKEVIIRDLDSMRLDQKQVDKTRSLLNSGELERLSVKFKELNESLRRIDNHELRVKDELDDKLSRLELLKSSVKDKESVNNKGISNINERIMTLKNDLSKEIGSDLGFKVKII